jgi:hypothetical protein
MARTTIVVAIDLRPPLDTEASDLTEKPTGTNLNAVGVTRNPVLTAVAAAVAVAVAALMAMLALVQHIRDLILALLAEQLRPNHVYEEETGGLVFEGGK